MTEFRDVRALAMLTPRERQVMQLICEGLSNKEIARRLSISEGTIKVHLHHICGKLVAKNRVMLAMLAAQKVGQPSDDGAETGNLLIARP